MKAQIQNDNTLQESVFSEAELSQEDELEGIKEDEATKSKMTEKIFILIC